MYIDKLRNPENAPEIKFCLRISNLGYCTAKYYLVISFPVKTMALIGT